MVDATEVARWRRRLGRTGVWVFGGAVDDDPAGRARFVEQLGYAALWLGGGNADETAFTRIEALLSGSQDLVVATGITNIWAWQPAELAARAARVSARFGDRFVLGLGVSHAPLVEQLGRRYERPYSAMVDFLDGLGAPGAAGAAGVPEASGQPGPPLVLAALGSRMLRLSADRTLGSHPYLTTPVHSRVARATLGPTALLAPEQALVLEEDPEVARSIGRPYLERYLRLPNYATNLRRIGWGVSDVEHEGSDALVDALVLHGSAEIVGAAVLAHLEAGADHVCVQPLADGGSIDWGALEALAPVLNRE